ncbi:TonB-dependent receptor [Acetobacter sp. AN02]|uniref:TonB-dependent receptor n=1 Tax=Acetobacter sp. AN02 TaxID=2894186 RepID=UPI0024344529|nr:TonB-dependent receptor [Acetobacter sp. AN02]MDG6095611.1 TonB-dependent receptor [Acetobacter sp. AN02]
MVHESAAQTHKPGKTRKDPAENVEVFARRHDFSHPEAQHLPDADTRLTAERLTKRGVVTLRDLQRVAPNLTIQSINGTASSNFYLRGLGFNDFTQNNMGPVLTYFDDVSYAYAAMATGLMFDLQDVRVTPGPVGTEHGQSDTGGEVRIRTNDPTDTWHYGASQDIASYARSRSEAWISGPLAKGLSFRIAGMTRQGGGWQRNADNGAHLGDADLKALRAKLRWQPDEHTTVMLSGHFVSDHSQVVTSIPVHRLIGSGPLPDVDSKHVQWSFRPEFARLIGRSASMKPGENNQFWGWDLRFSHDFGYATVTSVSAFETQRRGELTDQDGTSLSQADAWRTIQGNTFTQEVRLSNSRPSDRFQWVAGAFYQRSRMDQEFFFDYANYTARKYFQVTDFGISQESISEFGHASYRLPHGVTLFAGLLHELDDRSINGLKTIIYGQSSRSFLPESTASNQFAGQAGISWQINPRALMYYKMSKGFKPGGFTANNTQIQAQLDPFQPETVLTYELGLKTDPIPGKLRINGAAFYNDFHHQQILGTVLIPDYGPLSEITNAPKSESWGFETTIDLHPFRHLFITQNLGWQRGTFQNFPTVNRAKTNAYHAATGEWKAINDNFSGVDMGQPKLTMNGEADWRQAVMRGYAAELGVDWMYRGSQAMTPGGTGFYRLPSYFLLGAHLTWRATSDRWQATLYTTNLLNRHYYESGGQATTNYIYIPGSPRFIGGRISAGF